MKGMRALAILWLLWGSAACGEDVAPVDHAAAQRHVRPRLTDEDVQGMLRPKELARPSPAPPASPAGTPPAPPLPGPAPITGCDPGGCRDSGGNRYNGWGPGMIRSDGRLCQQVGSTMQCN